MHEVEAALGTRQCTLRNMPWLNFRVPKEFLQLKFSAQCRLFMLMTVVVCTLWFTGLQNPGLGRKSHGYSCWDADGVIHMDFLEPGTTINSEHYNARIKSLKQWLRRAWKYKKNILPQHDARPHTSWTTTEATEKLPLTILQHLPKRSYLVPCDLHLFPKMKEDLLGHLCDSS